jgi:hypothetical protein
MRHPEDRAWQELLAGFCLLMLLACGLFYGALLAIDRFTAWIQL